MVDFDETDLVNSDYVNSVTKGDDPNYTAIKDRQKVSKKELYEVVWFCDAFVKNHDVPKNKASFQKAERLLRLPAASKIVMRNELNDFVWENW